MMFIGLLAAGVALVAVAFLVTPQRPPRHRPRISHADPGKPFGVAAALWIINGPHRRCDRHTCPKKAVAVDTLRKAGHHPSEGLEW